MRNEKIMKALKSAIIRKHRHTWGLNRKTKYIKINTNHLKVPNFLQERNK